MKRFMLLPILLAGCVKEEPIVETPQPPVRQAETVPPIQRNLTMPALPGRLQQTQQPVIAVDLSQHRFLGPVKLVAHLFIDDVRVDSAGLTYQPVITSHPTLGQVWINGGGSFEYWTGNLNGKAITLTRGTTSLVNSPDVVSTFPDGKKRDVSSWPTAWGLSTAVSSQFYCSYIQAQEKLIADVWFEWKNYYPSSKTARIEITN